MSLSVGAIIALGTEAAKALRSVMDKLPSQEQKALERFFEVQIEYNKEITRSDQDHDDMLHWRERIKLLNETVAKQIAGSSKK